uniref:Uncharacterized protein n=1 Tax=Anopheles atroparvus TaxID=41427 RepID=A0AAG5DQ96_ANOAO
MGYKVAPAHACCTPMKVESFFKWQNVINALESSYDKVDI